MCGEGEGIHALALGAAARMSHAARKNLVLATAARCGEGGGDAGRGEAGSGGGGGGGGQCGAGGSREGGRSYAADACLGVGGGGGSAGGRSAVPAVMRVSYITVTPDVDQSSNRGYR